ncbi:thiamine-phosphate kinase [Micromonospora sp. WMMD1128]|uniref:thiamine-phosphate kinase n=1 Tax=unclassified Micromonospora TaxID=2617518 RepID=UPI00248BF391|nr:MULTISPECIES: thiamine-phosphate kinase [unclassified Micromonospora]WBB75572.1 thiamine-phosphate kinase [Micromonospora sp. WMMD1128]WFE31036.1 thiamine-phosphate kinase [Micromonospora sp. WMMD975]
MNSEATYSDEPTRVAMLVGAFLAGQSGAVLGDGHGPHATLTGGADARDDCAVYEVDGPVTLVVGSDYVRGPKFALYEQGLLTNFDIGYYVVAANVSDVAAMGAAPIGVLTVVRYPHDLDDDAFLDIMAGINQACADFGTLNVGGDIGNAERIVLSASAIGICRTGTALTRRGARPGDYLCVTGPCGVLGAAVAYFPKRSANGWHLADALEQDLLDGWRRPRARVAEGRVLSTGGYATACQDTSDGLKATIEQLAATSRVGFEVTEDDIAVHPAVSAVAKLIGSDDVTLAMSASADFQLAFTVPADRLDACRDAFARNGLTFDVIGRATAPESGVAFVGRGGDRHALPGVAWKHQTTDVSGLVAGVTAPTTAAP